MTVSRHTFAARNHPAWWAFLLHRISGLALVIFLPVHLFVLSMGLEDSSRLDRFLTWADTPLVKLAETVLVCLFAVHAAGALLQFGHGGSAQRAARCTRFYRPRSYRQI